MRPFEIFDPSNFKGRVPSSFWLRNHKYFFKIFFGPYPQMHANPIPVRQILVSLAFNMFLQITKHTPGRYGFSVTCLYWSLLLFLGWFTASVIPWDPETNNSTISGQNRIIKSNSRTRFLSLELKSSSFGWFSRNPTTYGWLIILLTGLKVSSGAYYELARTSNNPKVCLLL